MFRLYSHLRLFHASAALSFICTLSFPIISHAETLIPHRAVYDLELETSGEKADVLALSGRLVYEFKGSKCLGFTTQIRFVTKITTGDAPERLTDQQTSEFESGDGKTFKFTAKTYFDNILKKNLEGSAVRSNTSIDVQLLKPKEARYHLGIADFPTIQLKKTIKEALKRHNFYSAPIYDATDDADKITDTTIVIGHLTEPKKDRKISGNRNSDLNKLLAMPYWPVTISYFNDKEHPDGLPVYRTSFYLYENGVTRNLLMDYGTFQIRGHLKTIEFLQNSETKACSAQNSDTKTVR